MARRLYKGNDSYYLEATSPRGGAPAGGGIFDSVGHGDVFAPDELPTGTWSYLAVTYDGSTLRLYVDGVEVSSTPESGWLKASSSPLEIGGDSIFGQYFQGVIDEVRVYSVARSEDQVRTDMRTPVGAGTRAAPPPPAPGTLTATATAGDRVELSWGAATDEDGIAGYELERCQGAGCTDFAQIATPTATSYTDTQVSPGGSYSYRVRAVDATGNQGPYSDTATATTRAAGPQPRRAGHVDRDRDRR